MLCLIGLGSTGLGSAAWAVTPLDIVFKNNSGQANSQVYIGFVGSALNAINNASGAAMSASTYSDPSWYTLDQVSEGVDLTGFSGRIYVGYGTPWTFANNGYEPSPTNPSDPNYTKIYDKMELTYYGNAADVADTSSIDYFSVPMTLKVYQGGTNGTLKGTINSSSRSTTLAALSNVTPTPGANLVKDSSGNVVRAIGPSVYPPTGAYPASPYDNFSSYLTYLQGTYGPAHAGTVADIKGYFGGVGPSPTTGATKGQNYNFVVTMDSSKDMILTGSATDIGMHTIEYKYADLTSPTGIYGANPVFYLDGSNTPTGPGNDIYGWMTGDLLAGLNIGALGSTVVRNGTQVGEMSSSQWFGLSDLFSGLQPNDPDYYNQWAATLSGLSNAYNFAYSDRFAPVTATLDPSVVDTLEIDIGGNAVPEPASLGIVAAGGLALLSRRRR